MKRSIVWVLIGVLLALGSLVVLTILDAPLSSGQSSTFASSTGDPIAVTYYPGKSPSGVLILSGFGSDQVMMKPIALEFVNAGVHVMTLDFPGQGLSAGALSFDNASTDRLSRILADAIRDFQARSTLPSEKIIIFGHSLGARVALQAAVTQSQRLAGLILFGAQVNLSQNTQSEFFTGTSDATLPWVQSLSPRSPDLPVYLLTGEWDDILTVNGASLLMEKLCGRSITPGESCASPARQWRVIPALVHNYEVYSPVAMDQAKEWAGTLWKTNIRDFAQPTSVNARIIAWLGFLAGLLISMAGLFVILRDRNSSSPQATLEITHPRRFLWGKLLLWLAAFPFAIILMVLYMIIPLNNPAFNLIYGGFIGGYGILLLILYRSGKAPGVSGKILPAPKEFSISPRQLAIALLFNITLAFGLTLYFQSGHGQVPLSGERIFWLFIFTPLTALGFWIGMQENQSLSARFPHLPGLQVWSMLVGLTPFFLRVVLMLVLSSTSGVIGAVIGLVILAIIILQGEITRQITQSAWLSVVLQSLLLFWLVLPSGPLFFRPF